MDDITKRLEILEGTVSAHDLVIGDMKEKQQSVEAEVKTMTAMIESIGDQKKACQEYDPEVTVVATNIPVVANENIMDVANHLIENGLKLPTLAPVRAMRMKSRNRYPGLVKIELPTVNDKVTVLRSKKKLADTREYKTVYLRTSESHSQRLAGYNFRKLLQQIPGGNNFRVAANGRITPKVNPNPHLNQGIDPGFNSRSAYIRPGVPPNSTPNISGIGTPVSMLSEMTQQGSHSSQHDRYHLSRDGY